MKTQFLKLGVDECGTVLLTLALSIGVFCIFAAFAVDVGMAFSTKRRMQVGADAAAFAGVEKLSNPTLANPLAITFAREIGELNGLSNTELAVAGAVIAGNWNRATSTFTANSAPFNALKVRVERKIPTYFAHIINFQEFALAAEAIAVRDGAGSAVCVIPLAITDDKVAGVQYGDYVEIGKESPGNWGKVQAGSAETTDTTQPEGFYSGMQNDVCGTPLRIGNRTPNDTGYSGLDNAFNDRMASNPYVVMPIVDSFPNGGGDVEVVGFVYARLHASSGGGANWIGTLQVLEAVLNGQTGGPNLPPFSHSRLIVR